MKTLIGALVTFSLLLAGAAIYTVTLDKTVDVLQNELTKLETKISVEDWHNCGKDADSFNAHWKKSEKWFELFVDHKQTDIVNRYWQETLGNIKCKNQSESIVCVGVLKELLRSISQNERLTPENIF